MSSGIIETIKKVALNTFEANNPVKILFGKVISVEPVTIELSSKLKLGQEALVINGSVEAGDEVSLIRCQGGQRYVVLGTRVEYHETIVQVGGTTGNTVVDKAVEWALNIASDSSHGYDQSKRWGKDYDCSSFVITAFEQAGVPVKSEGGATYTGNMRTVFLKYGFKDVTNEIKLQNGDGLKKGDVLLNTKSHAALFVSDKTIVHASINEKGTVTGGKTGDQTGKEICTRTYYNHPWNYVLRYVG